MTDKFDNNLSIDNKSFDDAMEVYDVTKAPFRLYGNCCNEETMFARMNLSIAKTVSEGVFDRANRAAGVRLRFKTNSRRVGIKVKFSKALQFPAQSAISTKGFDIYIDGKYHSSIFCNDSNSLSYEQISDLENSEEKDIVIYFPYNAVVEEFFIALDKASEVYEGNDYKIKSPVVFYGSSITHGFCVSRPGNTFTAMLSRKLDADYINLGFSGVCRGETEMAKYIASLDKSVFVCGYDHNESEVEELSKRHLPFYEKFREIDKNTPILFVSSPNLLYKGKPMNGRMEVVKETYKYALENGDKNIYFIDGQTIYPEDIRFDCTADAIHPNDLGAYMISEKIYEKLREILYCDKK